MHSALLWTSLPTTALVIASPAAPAHPTGGGGTFCTRSCMYVSTRMKILGGGRDQGFSLISFTGLSAKVSPQPFASGLR